MIDTVRFRISADPILMAIMERKSVEFKTYDHNEKKLRFQIFRTSINLGSFFYAISIQLSEDCFYLEFSVPKYLYGHNVLMIRAEEAPIAVDRVYNDMRAFFCTDRIPAPINWILTRIDLCYAWRTYDDQTAEKAIQYIKNQNYSRKKTASYGTSAMFIGTDSTLKFYMKGPEVFAHDWKKIKKFDIDRANTILNIAKGVVRMEVTLRHKAICSLLHIPINSINMLNSFDTERCTHVLQKYLLGLLGTDSKTMSLSTIFDKFKTGSPRLSLKLYQFYRLYMSSDPVDKLALREMPPSTLRRYKKAIRDLHVGIPEHVTGTVVEFTVPSNWDVGFFSSPRSNTGGTAHQ